VRSVAYSPDGLRLAIADDDGRIDLLDTATMKIARSPDGHNGRVRAMRFSPDGALLVSAADDNSAIIWDCATGDALQGFQHGAPVSWAEFLPARGQVLTASLDGTVRLWDMRSGFERRRVAENQGDIRQVRFSPAGGNVVVVRRDEPAEIWTLPDPIQNVRVEDVMETLAALNAPRASDDARRQVGLDRRTPHPAERSGLLHWRWWARRLGLHPDYGAVTSSTAIRCGSTGFQP
jgi:WD40 repeat protein